MPIIGTIASSRRAAFAPASFESIASTTLGSNQSTITFNNIPQTFQHLQLRVSAIQDTGNDWRGGYINFNDDVANNYTSYNTGGGGSGNVGGGAATVATVNFLGAGWSSLLFPGVSIVDIIDYTNTNKFKGVRTFNGIERNGTPRDVQYANTVWRNTSAITKIVITVNAPNYVTGSSFALYGIKAA